MLATRTPRGRPKSEGTKQLVSVHYGPEVLAYFKSAGEGWQSRMDDMQRDYVTLKEDIPKGKQAALPETIESFEIFPWIGDFETGIAFMDEQHQTLVRLLNVLARDLVTQSDSLSFDEVFRELSEYAIYHFAAEEDLLRQVFAGDVLESGHQQAHREFVQEIGRLKEQSATKPVSKRIEEVVAFISRWLAYHILDVDRRMAKVVLAVQAGIPLEAAKAQADLEMSGAVKGLIDAVLGMYEKLSFRTFHLMKEIVERKEVERRPVSVQQLEWEHIHRVLLQHDGNISAAARTLNMHRRTLQRKLRKPTPWWSRAPGSSPHGHPAP
jgi:hemerythrin-like metal-binding protein